MSSERREHAPPDGARGNAGRGPSEGPSAGPAQPGGEGEQSSGGQSSTHFGYSQVPVGDKVRKVREVFDSVAPSYDLMNDLMSGGLHRIWKRFTIRQAALRPGMRVLDLATGSGDLARAMARDQRDVEVWMTDINAAMLAVGRDRAIDDGLLLPAVQCDAERLPFPDRYFDRVTVAFGLRNMTRKEAALAEMRRVLAPGGKLLVLEFSRVWKPLAGAYDAFSFGVLPAMGAIVARDSTSYRYLAESIRMHPDQQTLADMMTGVGFRRVKFFNLTAGVVALHEGVRY